MRNRMHSPIIKKNIYVFLIIDGIKLGTVTTHTHAQTHRHTHTHTHTHTGK
jgi:hypothetical protein